MSNTLSSPTDNEDIFDKNQIKLLSYDKFYLLNRIVYAGQKDGKYHYINRFNNTVLVRDNKLKTLDDYKNYFLIVY
ncbi:lef10 [Artaxa digramma nucleopolyhedrovirus]|uniref:Lef10 n=1 Tax=Artaxa digramma nucleopolyhedrovirus TaxID=3070910 RepID=A0AAE6R683_9ABAC|nr:lef10 [Euproctis digramma nucleopolyhedrovirus]QHB21690.1 lef10 [Artaxa digramma nucleopolyhedrovirus]